MICIMNHITRDVSDKKASLDSIGRDYKVFTDTTEFRSSKNLDLKYVGINTNYVNILSHKCDSRYKVILHDDIPFDGELFHKIEYVMDYAPEGIVSFFNPTNNLYRGVNEKGINVVRTQKNFWTQCIAFPQSLEAEYIQFVKPFIGRSHYAEDGLMKKYLNETGRYLHVVVPSFVQHEGYNRSLYGIPGKVGKNKRNSETYDPGFNVENIDWKAAFSNPFIDNEKYKL